MPGGGAGALGAWYLQRLINELGGNTVVKAIYHSRYNGGATPPFTSIPDARGSGFGPTLTSGSLPFDTTGNFWAFTTSIAAFCAANAIFDLSSSCSIVYIGTLGRISSGFEDIVVIDDSASQNRNFEIGTTSTAGQWGTFINPTVSGGVSLGITETVITNVRLVWVSQVSSASIKGQVYNHAIASATPSGLIASGNNALNINTWKLVTNVGEATINVRMVLFMKPSLTTGQIQTLANFAKSDSGFIQAA